MPRTYNHIFEKFDTAATACVGEPTKARAIALCNRPSSRLVSLPWMRQFYESLDCIGWKQSVGANWVWRYKKPGNTDSEEVLLERAVAILDTTLWACQMSTSSGVEGPYLHRRRAIDLVRYIRPRNYAFVELKVSSDNPLYAAFEILGYALAYLHAKANGWIGAGDHNVFDAERIELTILGPENWYSYGKRGTDNKFEYNLDWLIAEITESLNDFVKADFSGAPTFTMAFRKFSGNNRDRQAEDIHQRAKSW